MRPLARGEKNVLWQERSRLSSWEMWALCDVTAHKKRRNSSSEKKAFPPIFALFCCPVAVVSHLPFDPKARICGLRPTTLLLFPFPLCIMHFIPVVSAPQSPSSFSKSGVCVVNKTFIPAGGGHGGEYINAAARCRVIRPPARPLSNFPWRACRPHLHLRPHSARATTRFVFPSTGSYRCLQSGSHTCPGRSRRPFSHLLIPPPPPLSQVSSGIASTPLSPLLLSPGYSFSPSSLPSLYLGREANDGGRKKHRLLFKEATISQRAKNAAKIPLPFPIPLKMLLTKVFFWKKSVSPLPLPPFRLPMDACGHIPNKGDRKEGGRADCGKALWVCRRGEGTGGKT